MTDPAILEEYGVHENYASVCLDGAKRDRLVWLGDLSHTTRIVPASTSRNYIVMGTLEYLLAWQTKEGTLPFAPPLGNNVSSARTAFAYGVGISAGINVYGVALVDYQILRLLDFANYIFATNDLQFARDTIDQWVKAVDFLLE